MHTRQNMAKRHTVENLALNLRMHITLSASATTSGRFTRENGLTLVIHDGHRKSECWSIRVYTRHFPSIAPRAAMVSERAGRFKRARPCSPRFVPVWLLHRANRAAAASRTGLPTATNRLRDLSLHLKTATPLMNMARESGAVFTAQRKRVHEKLTALELLRPSDVASAELSDSDYVRAGSEPEACRGIRNIKVRRTSFQSGSGLGAWPCRSAL